MSIHGVNGKLVTAIAQDDDDGGDGGDGGLATYSSSGEELVMLAAQKDVGGALDVYNKTGEIVCTMYPDDYGNGVIGAWNRKDKGKTLKPGP